MLEQRPQAPAPAPDLIPAKNQPRTNTGIGAADGALHHQELPEAQIQPADRGTHGRAGQEGDRLGVGTRQAADQEIKGRSTLHGVGSGESQGPRIVGKVVGPDAADTLYDALALAGALVVNVNEVGEITVPTT